MVMMKTTPSAKSKMEEADERRKAEIAAHLAKPISAGSMVRAGGREGYVTKVVDGQATVVFTGQVTELHQITDLIKIMDY